MNLEEIFRPVKAELALVEKRLREVSHSENECISRAVSEVLSAGGKRLRPALVLMAAKACNYNGDRGVNRAVAVELIHTASLIHDDVLDDADLRRGIPTINSRWGNRVSVLTGDHLYSKAVGILAEDGDLEVLRTVADTAGTMTDRETTEALCRHDANVTEEKYVSIIAGKTASLMFCSCRIGAMLGEARNGEVEVLGEYGLNLGMAFQITDDLLDLAGEKERLGKPVGNDIRDGVLTLPLIHAMSVAEEKDREWMISTVRAGRIDDDILTRMRDVVKEYGGTRYSLEKAKEYAGACKERLKSLQPSESQSSLVLLADYVIERAY